MIRIRNVARLACRGKGKLQRQHLSAQGLGRLIRRVVPTGVPLPLVIVVHERIPLMDGVSVPIQLHELRGAADDLPDAANHMAARQDLADAFGGRDGPIPAQIPRIIDDVALHVDQTVSVSVRRQGIGIDVRVAAPALAGLADCHAPRSGRVAPHDVTEWNAKGTGAAQGLLQLVMDGLLHRIVAEKPLQLRPGRRMPEAIARLRRRSHGGQHEQCCCNHKNSCSHVVTLSKSGLCIYCEALAFSSRPRRRRPTRAHFCSRAIPLFSVR